MTRDEAVQCVYARWVAEWVVPASPGPGNVARTPFALDDEKLEPDGRAHALLNIQHMNSGSETLGSPRNRKFRRPANLFIRLRVKPGGGRAPLDGLVRAAKEIYEGRSLCAPDLVVYQVTDREQGIIENGRWSAALVQVRFEYFEVK